MRRMAELLTVMIHCWTAKWWVDPNGGGMSWSTEILVLLARNGEGVLIC